MNYETLALLVRAMLTCLDKEQARALEKWVMAQAIHPDPASDNFMSAEKRRMDAAIDRAVIEIRDHAGRNA